MKLCDTIKHRLHAELDIMYIYLCRISVCTCELLPHTTNVKAMKKKKKKMYLCFIGVKYEIGRKLAELSSDGESLFYLEHRLSIAMQKGNSATCTPSPVHCLYIMFCIL